MKYLLYLLPFIAIWGCEMPAQTSCKADSLQLVVNNYRDSVKAWKNVVSINHMDLEIMQNSMRDISADLDAEREQKEKYRARLRDAIAVIKRDSVQLARCVINGSQPKKLVCHLCGKIITDEAYIVSADEESYYEHVKCPKP